MRTVNPNLHPKEGYFFQESDGAKIFGNTWAGVIARVKWYRQKKNQAQGNVEHDVMAQACDRNPSLCRNTDNSFLTLHAPLKSRVLTWLNGFRARKDAQFVDAETARQRAQICAGCPQNQSLSDSCATCKATIKAMRRDILGTRFLDGRLNECNALGEDLPVASHLEISAVENSGLPGNCWRKRSL